MTSKVTCSGRHAPYESGTITIHAFFLGPGPCFQYFVCPCASRGCTGGSARESRNRTSALTGGCRGGSPRATGKGGGGNLGCRGFRTSAPHLVRHGIDSGADRRNVGRGIAPL